MANKGPQGRLGATDSSPRPGCFALGSAQSRATARAMLITRKAREEDELDSEAVSILDGSRLIDGLAETIRKGRMRNRAGVLPASFQASASNRDGNGERGADCLSERIWRGRERVKRIQGPGKFGT
jgi:hypothetical protein